MQQQADAALHDLRAVAHELQLHAVREALVLLQNVLFDRLGDVDGVLRAFAHHGDGDAALAVEAGDERVLVEAVIDDADLAERELGAVRACQDDDAAVIIARVGTAAGADGDIARFRLHHTRREVKCAAADGGADLIQREAVFAQTCLGDLDADLVIAHAGEVGVGDAGQGGDFIPHLLAEAAQIALGHVGGEDHADDGAHEVVVLDDGPLRQSGEVRDGIHADLHVVDDLAREVGVLNLHHHIATAGGGGGDDALDPRHLLDGILDAQYDGLLHLLRRRARVGDVHRDEAGRHVREDLDGDAL